MPEAVIVSAVRTPVGRAYKGSLRATRPDDLAALAIKEALARVPGLDAKEIDDVILGCAMPEGEQGMNVARIAALRAGLPVETSAMTVNRFCSSGLQAIALAAERIRSGSAEVIVPTPTSTWASARKTSRANSASRASKPTGSPPIRTEKRLPPSPQEISKRKLFLSK
jgi:acetyl-CoA acyltransferase